MSPPTAHATMRLVAVDLDRTLLDDSRAISEKNREALYRSSADGVTIAICSGRDLPATRAVTRELSIPLWLLVQNGSLVIDPAGNAISVNRMAAELAHAALDVFDEHELAPVVYDVHPRSNRVWWQEGAQAAPGVLEFRTDHGTEVTFVSRMRDVVDSDVSHMEVFGTKRRIFDAQRKLTDIGNYSTLANISASRRDQAFMGAYSAGTSKESALAALAQRIGIDRAQVLAVGDNLNDVGMVRWAGVGAMVANGPEEARAAADWIAPSNNDDGVAEAIERYAFRRP